MRKLPFLFLWGAMSCSVLAEPVPVYRLTAAQQQAWGIETATLRQLPEGSLARLPAKVQVPSEQLRLVSAPVAGRLESLTVAPGMRVKRGQVLARLSSPQALELHREAMQAGSQADLLQTARRRDEALFAEGLIAESRLQSTRAAAEQADIQARERRQMIAMAGGSPGHLSGQLVLTAPIDGVVLEQHAQLGERVEPSAVIFRIAKLSPLWVDIQLPLAQAADVREGMPIRVVGKLAEGTLLVPGRAVDPLSQSVLVRGVLKKGADQLIPGQAVEVEITGRPAVGLRIPAAAVIRHEGGAFVFVQQDASAAGSRFSPRPVRVVAQSGATVVVEGLGLDDVIATKGLAGLKSLLTGVGKE